MRVNVEDDTVLRRDLLHAKVVDSARPFELRRNRSKSVEQTVCVATPSSTAGPRPLHGYAAANKVNWMLSRVRGKRVVIDNFRALPVER